MGTSWCAVLAVMVAGCGGASGSQTSTPSERPSEPPKAPQQPPDHRTYAVLGIEVAGSVDTESVTISRWCTDELRALVRLRHQLPPGGSRDLLNEKITNDCGNEAVDCMTKIAASIRSEVLIYGKLERRPKDAVDGYQLKVRMLRVEKQNVQEKSMFVTLGELAEERPLREKLRRLYEELSGEL